MEDVINNPSHYKGRNGLECVDVLQAFLTPEEFLGWCKGNALKYLLRAGKKGSALEDVAKAGKLCEFHNDFLRASPLITGVAGGDQDD